MWLRRISVRFKGLTLASLRRYDLANHWVLQPRRLLELQPIVRTTIARTSAGESGPATSPLDVSGVHPTIEVFGEAGDRHNFVCNTPEVYAATEGGTTNRPQSDRLRCLGVGGTPRHPQHSG